MKLKKLIKLYSNNIINNDDIQYLFNLQKLKLTLNEIININGVLNLIIR